MSRPSLLALWALVALSGCAAMGSEDALGPGVSGTGGSAANSAGSGGKGQNDGGGGGVDNGSGGSSSGSAGTGMGGGAAGTSPGGGVGGVGGGEVFPPSAECVSCVRSLCLNCPEGDATCEPCSVDAGLCEGKPSSEVVRLCVCDSKCAELCGGSTYCPPVLGPPSDSEGNGDSCFDNKAEDDGLVDCDAPRCAGQCASPCFQAPKVSVGAGSITMTGRWKGHADVLTPPCALDPQSGPDILYEVTSEVTGFLKVRVASDADALLSVRTGCQQGTELYCRNDVGAKGAEELTLPVVAKTPIWLAVGAAKPLATETYQLTMQALEAKCHDSVVTPDEECDSGEDDATCVECRLTACKNAQALTVNAIATPPATATMAVQPSCVPLDHKATPEHVYAVRADADGRFEAVLRSAGQDLTLSVRGSCQSPELGCSDEAPGGDGAIERLVVPAVKGQTFYVVVESFDDEPPGDYTLWTRSSGLACGDGVAGVTEQCDLGKANGDGTCTAHCTLKLPDGTPLEQEPNDLSYQAKSPGGEIGGEIFPAGDVDLHRIEIAKAGTFTASIAGATGSACDAPLQGGLLDSELRLRTLDGTLVARNDNLDGVCSALSLPLAAGKYLLEVRASGAASEQVFSYILHTSIDGAPLP